MAGRLFHFFADSEDKHVFWLFWVLVGWPLAVYLGKRYLGKPDAVSDPFMLAIIAAPFLVGVPLWLFLKMDALSFARNLVVGVQGLVLLMFLSLMIPVLVYGGLFYHFDRHVPDSLDWILFVALGLFLIPGFFLAGCWLGFKVDKPMLLIVFWGVVVLVLFGFGMIRWTLTAKCAWKLAAILIPLLIGTYAGSTRLSRKEEPS